MARVLEERFARVFASDVHDYGCGKTGSFVGVGPDVVPHPERTGWGRPDWIITNPPFNLALEFAVRALNDAGDGGVALLVRSAWLEGTGRYHGLFNANPPSVIAQFVERVPMVRGRWDPDASTATAYCWIVWHAERGFDTRFEWIPPGCRERLTRPDDRERFANVD